MTVLDDIIVKSYYAGHVLGACMFYVNYNNVSFVYTGDFNSSADRHLGPAFIDKIAPDLIISESTYATLTRDSKR
jgi:integrator complex subunit 11